MQNIVILTSARIRQNSYSQVNIISAKDFFQSVIKPNRNEIYLLCYNMSKL